jgi:hypothetical protein
MACCFRLDMQSEHAWLLTAYGGGAAAGLHGKGGPIPDFFLTREWQRNDREVWSGARRPDLIQGIRGVQKGIWFFSKLERPALSRILDLPRRKRWIGVRAKGCVVPLPPISPDRFSCRAYA